jgi:hypothetical protein
LYLRLLVDAVELDHTELHGVVEEELQRGIKVALVECNFHHLIVELVVQIAFFIELLLLLCVVEGAVGVLFKHHVDNPDDLEDEPQEAFLEFPGVRRRIENLPYSWIVTRFRSSTV